MEFQTIRRNDAVAHQAVATIKRMIAEGDLGPRQRLPAERELAGHLGVSRPSLREAIRALTALNILESRQGDGTYVSSLEPELLAEPIDFVLQINRESISAFFEARQVLEVGAAALAAERATDIELASLADHTKAGRLTLDDSEAFIEHDIEFHRRISKMARSPILASMLASVRTLAYLGRRGTAQVPSMRKRALLDHEKIVQGLRARDAAAASGAMADHLKRSGAIAVKALEDEMQVIP